MMQRRRSRVLSLAHWGLCVKEPNLSMLKSVFPHQRMTFRHYGLMAFLLLCPESFAPLKASLHTVKLCSFAAAE